MALAQTKYDFSKQLLGTVQQSEQTRDHPQLANQICLILTWLFWRAKELIAAAQALHAADLSARGQSQNVYNIALEDCSHVFPVSKISWWRHFISLFLFIICFAYTFEDFERLKCLLTTVFLTSLSFVDHFVLEILLPRFFTQKGFEQWSPHKFQSLMQCRKLAQLKL